MTEERKYKRWSGKYRKEHLAKNKEKREEKKKKKYNE